MTHPNSARAFASVADSLSGLRAKVFRALVSARKPLTDEALQFKLGMSGNTQRPRRLELLERGLIEPAGQARTRSGHRATTWRAVKP